MLLDLPNSSAQLELLCSSMTHGLALTQVDTVIDSHEQHSLEVCLLSTGCQLAEGTIQHTPDILWEVCVWGNVAPPQVIQELQAIKAPLRFKPS